MNRLLTTFKAMFATCIIALTFSSFSVMADDPPWPNPCNEANNCTVVLTADDIAWWTTNHSAASICTAGGCWVVECSPGGGCWATFKADSLFRNFTEID